jgi:zinc protease
VDRTQQPGAGRPREFRPPVPERVRLSNGLDLLVVEKHEVPTIAAAVYFPGGALTDPADAPGLTSFTARLVPEGTQRRTSLQIAEESEFIAARLGVDVHREYASATTQVLTRHWPRALDLLADVLANPSFPEREVERVRKERLTDFRRLRDDANAIADRVLTGLLYGRETAYGHPISGREVSVAGMAREAMAQHHREMIRGGRPTFVLVGDIGIDEAAQQIEGVFKDLSPRPSPERGGVSLNNPSPKATTIYLVDKPGAAQSVISAGQLGVSRLHEDYVPLVVMNMAFGGQFTARLNMNLREDKGYTYGYRSGFDWRLTRSRFTAGGSVQTAVTREALVETLKEFRDLQTDRPLTEEEFEKARLGLIRGYPPTFETLGHILGRMLDLVHYGLPDDYFRNQVERLQAVTLADAHRVAAAHVDPEALSIVVVGDRSAIEPGLKELNLPIVHLDHEGEPVD